MKRICKKCGYLKREGKFYEKCISDNDPDYPEWYFIHYDICKDCVKEVKQGLWESNRDTLLKEYYRGESGLTGN